MALRRARVELQNALRMNWTHGGTVKSAKEYAREVHEDLFDHRRGIWDCGDGISCLFDNDPHAHCAVEIEALRTALTNAGCVEVELATYHRDSTHTLAVLVRGDARTIFSAYETVDRQLDLVRQLDRVRALRAS
jgi:hypothetical protein